MHAQARAALAHEPDPVAEQVELVQGRGEDAAALVGGGFDAVLRDGVLMYLDEPQPLLSALVAAVQRDPYRGVARLFHLVVRKTDTTPAA